VVVERYNDSEAAAWDDFVERSRNAPFLFKRAYMDYHRDRFDDYSLIVRAPEGSILAVLPAHKRDATVNSHMGLTYGGFAVGPDMKIQKMLQVFGAVIPFLQKEGFTSLLYKTVPYIYHSTPSEEDRFALHLCKAQWHLSSPTTVVLQSGRLPYQTRRTRGIKRALKHSLEIRETDDYVSFWEMLTRNLEEGHMASPVHSVEEILLLKARCPSNIRLFAAFEDATMVAGVVIYESAQVAHAQYIASASRGRDIGALDLLFHKLLTEIFQHKTYFDFGTSSEREGVNGGLIEQKEGFGARVVTQDWYRVDLTRVCADDFLSAIL
jgi:hypothetical protein